MKTPRDILLARHRAAVPKLDGLRQAAMATVHECCRSAAGPRFQTTPFDLPSSFFHHPGRAAITLWRELILPSRRLWTGLTTVWVLLLVINLSQRDPVSSVTGKPVHSPAAMMSWQAQQRWMNELMADRTAPPPDADRPRTIEPRPRTENHAIVTA